MLLARTQTLIGTIVTEFGFEAADNLGQRLAKKKLEARPLIDRLGLADVEAIFRTSTVHRVKGESLDAVLYIAKKPHVRGLLDGTGYDEKAVSGLSDLHDRECDCGVFGADDEINAIALVPLTRQRRADVMSGWCFWNNKLLTDPLNDRRMQILRA